MTREEREKAIDALKISAPVITVTQEEFYDYIQALNKIMNWLEQQPCTDAISRQAVLEVINFYDGQNQQHFTVDNLRDDIENIPPVTPAEKVGHWEWDRGFWCRRCSECHLSKDSKYSNCCPNCGAKMQEVEE